MKKESIYYAIINGGEEKRVENWSKSEVLDWLRTIKQNVWIYMKPSRLPLSKSMHKSISLKNRRKMTDYAWNRIQKGIERFRINVGRPHSILNLHGMSYIHWPCYATRWGSSLSLIL